MDLICVMYQDMDLIWMRTREPGDSPAVALSVFYAAGERRRIEEATMIQAAAAFAAQSSDEHGEIGYGAIAEFAAVSGRSFDAGADYLREAVELTTRLPRTWEQVRIDAAGPVVYLDAVLDHADALALDTALTAIAGTLDTAESLDVRRSRALGILARGEAAGATATLSREVVVHVHLSDHSTIARVRSHTGRPPGITSIDQVRDWCTDATKVVVRPVIDPAMTLTSSGYVHPPASGTT